MMFLQFSIIRLHSLLSLAFTPLGGIFNDVPAVFHNKVTFSNNLIEGSSKIEGTGMVSSLVLKFFDYL